MTNHEKPGVIQRARIWLNGGFTRLVPYIGVGAVTSFVTIQLFAPDHPLGKLVMVGEVCLSVGLALGYMAGGQIEEATE